MPITPNLVERTAVHLNLVPGVLLDFLGAQAFRTLCAGVELGSQAEAQPFRAAALGEDRLKSAEEGELHEIAFRVIRRGAIVELKTTTAHLGRW